MKNILSVELYNISKRKELKLAILILLSATILNFIGSCIIYKGFPLMEVRSSYDLFALNNIRGMFIVDSFTVIFPIIVVSIYSDSIFIETKKNINTFILTRVSKKKWLFGKVITVFLVTFLVVLTPLIINYILCRYTFPSYTANNSFSAPTYNLFSYDYLNELKHIGENVNIFSYIYIYNPYLHYLTIVILKALQGGLFSILGIAFSMFIKKSKVVAIISVFIFTIVIDIINGFLPINDTIITSLDSPTHSGILNYIVSYIIIMILTYILIRKSLKKDDLH
ncbi:MAG: hypothetical protein ACRDA4_01825 [Filifactoraceae bacterium]